MGTASFHLEAMLIACINKLFYFFPTFYLQISNLLSLGGFLL